MKFDSNYIQAYFLLEKWENMQTSKGLLVYSNIAEDKGGETVFGITRKYQSNNVEEGRLMSDIVNESKQFIIIKPSSITEQSPSGLVYQLIMTAILNI